jgi:hypothetical protein
MAEIKTVELHIKSNVDTASKEFDNFAKSIKAVDKSATNLDATFEEVYGDLQPLTTRMGEAEDRLYELALAGKQGTQEFKDLLTSVGNYRKVQIQTDMVVDNAATTMSQKLTGALQLAAGGFSLVQGSMSLFGSESEDVEQAILKVQSAMAITQGIESIALGAKSVRALGTAIQATTVFQKAATAAQWLWTAAMNANPIGAIVASISALLIGGYKLIKFFQDSSSANEKAATSTRKNTSALKEQSIAASQSSNKLKSYNDKQYALAEAAGASSEELRKLALKHKEEEIALNKKNAVLAQSTFLRERDTLASLKNNDASDEVIANQEKLVQSTYDSFKKQNELLSTSYKERAALRNANEVAEVAENKAASDKALEAQKQAKEIAKQERIDAQKELDAENSRLARERGEKAREEYENAEKLANEIKQKNIDATKTENQLKVEAENAEYERKKAILIQANLSTEELEKLHKQNLYNLDLEYWGKQADAAKEQADREIALDAAVRDAKRNALNEGLNILLEFAGKNKTVALAILAVQKGLAIADIVVGASKAIAISNANLALIPAILPPGIPNPAYPFAVANNLKSILATKISAATGIASILASGVSQASSIKGGSVSNSGSVGQIGSSSSPAPVSAAPTFNVVGTSGVNQIAQTLGSQSPIKAYVVANDVSSQQSLDRNIVKTATLGN